MDFRCAKCGHEWAGTLPEKHHREWKGAGHVLGFRCPSCGGYRPQVLVDDEWEDEPGPLERRNHGNTMDNRGGH